MANDIAGGPVKRLSWAGKQVRIEEVENTLSSLWKISVDNMRTGANLNVRTSVLNLVICAPNVEQARHASKLLRDLSSTHIARATIIVLDQRPDAPDALDSWVTLRCFSMISDLMRHCFEQTTLLLSGHAIHALSSVLPAVLKAHLPVYLWWIGDARGADDAIFRTVAEMCQRVIVDSATFLHPEQDIHALASYCKGTPDVAISDLNWGRLTPWRQLVIQFFDVAEYLPFLDGLEHIEIEYVATPGEQSAPRPTCALLLAGWLNGRLGLSLSAEREKNLHDTTGGAYQWLLDLPSGTQRATMQIQPHLQADLLPGSIYLVRLTCNVENRRAIFNIKRDADTSYVLTSVESVQEARPMRTVNLPDKHEESELLRKEMEIMVHDQLFERTLQEMALLIDGDQKEGEKNSANCDLS